MKIRKYIKQLIPLMEISALVLLLLFSPCKVRNSIQTVLKIPKTEVSNKSVSASKNSKICEAGINTTISKQETNVQKSKALINKKTHFNAEIVDYIKKPITTYCKARDEIPPLAPYYILYKNNKAYL